MCVCMCVCVYVCVCVCMCVCVYGGGCMGGGGVNVCVNVLRDWCWGTDYEQCTSIRPPF